jgi:outer membrane immunogenic protein
VLIKGASLMKTLISSVLLGALLTGSAMAADMRMPTKAPPAPPPPVYSWTGCYLGGGGGYGMFDEQHDFETATGAGIIPQFDSAGRGWFGTVQGGCDIQFGSFVPALAGSMLFGVFADGDWGRIKGNDSFGGLTGNDDLDESWAAGARLGWLPTDRFLTFVSGGFTQTHIEDITFTGPRFTATLPAHRENGWFIGTGYEYQLGWFPGLTWKTEYRYADYGSRTDAIFEVPVPITFSSHRELFVQTLRSELIWRFNWGGAPIMSRY